MKHYVIKSGFVVDVVLWDGSSPWTYPFDHDSIIQSEANAGIGWSFMDGEFIPPIQDEQ